MFRNDIIELPKLVRIDGEVRHYETPDGQKYPSVTTVLSAMQDKTHLIKWRQRVGEEEAAKKTAQAGRRGTATHLLCEKLVLNEPIDLKDQMPLSIQLFRQLEGHLNKHVNDIRSSEGQLFSHKLRVAGSVDLVASYDGDPAIIDFKTSYKPKRKEWIENYFMQAAMYSYMLYEMTGLYHPKLVVMIALEEDSGPQIFVEHVKNWIGKAKDTCERYHANYPSNS